MPGIRYTHAIMKHMSRFQMSWKCVIISVCLFDENNSKNISGHGHGSGGNQQDSSRNCVRTVGGGGEVLVPLGVLEHDTFVCAHRLILLSKILPAF